LPEKASSAPRDRKERIVIQIYLDADFMAEITIQMP
jgi:hypothetical protein